MRPGHWDPSLYAGSAGYYAQGRVRYPRELAEQLASTLGLDRSGRLLDVGCGPGSLTLLLAPYVGRAVGLDPDPDMLSEARRLAELSGATNVSWRQLPAEDLPGDLGEFEVVTFAQSFHWLDRPRVAATVRTMLAPGGALVHVHATTHQGVDSPAQELPFPQPPRSAINDLVRTYLGPVRRAGSRSLPGDPASGESDVYRAAGFTGAERITVPGAVVRRTTDDVVAGVFSLSSAAPHLFGTRQAAFESELRALLGLTSPSGTFSEEMPEIAVDVWRA